MADLFLDARVTTDIALSGRAAPLARAVADVVEQRCSAASDVRDTVSFLRDWAGSVAHGAPAPGAVPAFDRLAAYFGISGAERDLLLLAGLPDEHEGLATTFRTLHPHGEPCPTVGLAA